MQLLSYSANASEPVMSIEYYFDTVIDWEGDESVRGMYCAYSYSQYLFLG